MKVPHFTPLLFVVVDNSCEKFHMQPAVVCTASLQLVEAVWRVTDGWVVERRQQIDSAPLEMNHPLP